MTLVQDNTLPTADPSQDSLYDAEEARYTRNRRIEAVAKWLLPCLVMALAIFGWDRVVAMNNIPKYILPSPGLVVKTLIADWPILFPAMLVTAKITLMALGVAVTGGSCWQFCSPKANSPRCRFFPLR